MTRPLIPLLVLTATVATVAPGRRTAEPRPQAAGRAAQHPPAAAPQRPPVLTAFALNDGALSASTNTPVVLTHSVVGARPSHYRVSVHADFAGAPWLPYVSRPTLGGIDMLTRAGCDVAGGSRQLRLFLQVRAALGEEVRVVNGTRTLQPVVAESNVLPDSICVVPPASR